MKFKKGDRVNTYSLTCDKGTVTSVKHDVIDVKLDNGAILKFHPKQCRKLKPPRKRREILVPESDDGTLQRWHLPGTKSKKKFYGGDKLVRFREVKE